MVRLRQAEIDVIAERIRVEGWCDRGYDDAFEATNHGRVNIGRAEADRKLRATAKNRLGRAVKIRAFTFAGEQGGVLVAALPEKADEIFAQYGEGFYGG